MYTPIDNAEERDAANSADHLFQFRRVPWPVELDLLSALQIRRHHLKLQAAGSNFQRYFVSRFLNEFT